MPTTQGHTLDTANDESSTCQQGSAGTSRPINPNRIFSFALMSENSIHERLSQLGVEPYQLA